MNNVIIHGTAGTGKSTNMENLRLFYGKTTAIDEFRFDRSCANLHSCLILSETPNLAGIDPTDRVISIQAAIVEAGV